MTLDGWRWGPKDDDAGWGLEKMKHYQHTFVWGLETGAVAEGEGWGVRAMRVGMVGG